MPVIGQNNLLCVVLLVVSINMKMPSVLLCATLLFLVNVTLLTMPDVGRH